MLGGELRHSLLPREDVAPPHRAWKGRHLTP